MNLVLRKAPWCLDDLLRCFKMFMSQEEMEKKIRQRLMLQRSYQQEMAFKEMRQQAEREEEEAFRRTTMAKMAEDDRIEQMNARKRRMKQLEHKREVEKLIEDRRRQREADMVRTALCMHDYILKEAVFPLPKTQRQMLNTKRERLFSLTCFDNTLNTGSRNGKLRKKPWKKRERHSVDRSLKKRGRNFLNVTQQNSLATFQRYVATYGQMFCRSNKCVTSNVFHLRAYSAKTT